ncbi:aspartate transcarbamylase [Capsaspora owczarzaki ATCC 30864]|uniref:Aspartate transcarbamylase n=1 Tax=Capsaspora owczarzaki (strain ATCC 30864) TaxID=595528 RepID=A0A0D2WSW2_CAPO3|nr:aspartate transcarbamylase [Capsaspora owczarzaki ATCC 30864]KJE94588.1 aspartate transcarbamylase [Capsaspora owczarzaki ATCC 30864]|eukprot:XP_004346899.2 aspartate transcarbamylase [Capsaspora owczarzaki ATCC 30864]
MTTTAASSTPEFPAGALVLDDGTSFPGFHFGAVRPVAGETVFQTGMVGYVEAITDPSYQGQILVVTYPLVGNYGVPSLEEADHNGLPLHIESSRIHVAGLIVSDYSVQHSHWRARQSLQQWLERENVPALFGVDTRALTKRIREKGALLGLILAPPSPTQPFVMPALPLPASEFVDPNSRNLVADVSRPAKTYYPVGHDAVSAAKPDSGLLTILAVDVGLKYNQIRCFTSRGVIVRVVPWDYDICADNNYDGLFISNGPGNPVMADKTIANLRKILQRPATEAKPIFGICLGHQLLALAAGATTSKLKFGNRGHNIPCIDLRSDRCYITTQNHGFAVEVATLPKPWQPMFINANDNTNEGIYNTELPYFSVQFHPESTPGPRDTEYLFSVFLDAVRASKARPAGTPLAPLPVPQRVKAERQAVRKVLVLGSGGLSIGQAGEFDYSGSQCIKALKQEGISTVLINPNIATIQTSKGLADKVYFLPVTPEYVLKVVRQEKPDGILVTFGGQTALNCGIKIRHELEALGCRVLGTQIDTIMATEDREIFAAKMKEIDEPVARSAAANTVAEAVEIGNAIGYPLIVRAAFTLGGLGSGFADNEAELRALVTKALATSPQVLVERSMKGWKEVEYEVVRDCNDNCITVCNMENFDPLGIHTGDSIVVAPSQTLSDREYHMLRNSAVKTIRHLGVVGECNIQFALNPDAEEYCIIEVNARLSRSSALASKATGYPLAFVAAKLALNIPLTQIKNSVTRVTSACFEPSLDYVVVKIPRWDLKKFDRVETQISSAMKSVGEVMAIARTFEEALQKGIRAIDDSLDGFCGDSWAKHSEAAIDTELNAPTDQRLFAVARAFDLGYSVDRIHDLTKIDRWFLHKLRYVAGLRSQLSTFAVKSIPRELMVLAKRAGFSDRMIARVTNAPELAAREVRVSMGIRPVVKQIDTVAAEFPAQTNYLYTTYNAVEDDVAASEASVMVLGSGVYRIGSSVEFDWCAVRCVRTLRRNGFKTIMVNYNPETVSTDYDEADKLYFDNITLETILDIYERERASGVILAMGGQVPNNIALPLHRQNVKIFGTSPVQIDMAENRYKFSRLLDSIGVDQPKWKELSSLSDARAFCDAVGYPVLVRPSYVLSGAAMSVVHTANDLESYLGDAVAVSRDHPVVISKYIDQAKEIDVDAVAKDGQLIMHLVSEHVENAGVHSGDATLIQPPQDLDRETVQRLESATAAIAKALLITGPFNIQFIAKDKAIKVIECNVRASRSFPFVSKTSGVDLVELSTLAMLGLPFKPYPNADAPKLAHVGVKVPLFSFGRLQGADPILGVEMASTGEVACFGRNKYEAYLKALLATNFKFPRRNGNVLLSIGSFNEKQEFLASASRLVKDGFKLFGTPGTSDFYSSHGIPIETLDDIGDTEDGRERDYSLTHSLAEGKVDLFVCLPSKNSFRRPSSFISRGYMSRRKAIDYQVPLVTNIKCAKILVEAMHRFPTPALDPIVDVDCMTSNRTVTLPGLVNMAIPASVDSINREASASLAGGFTTVGVNAETNQGHVALTDVTSLEHYRDQIFSSHTTAHCDLGFWAVFAAGSEASRQAGAVDVLVQLAPNTIGLLIDLTTPATTAPSSTASGSVASVFATLDLLFSRWPSNRAIFVRASGSELASVLYLGALHNRSVHATQLTRLDDLQLIVRSQARRAQQPSLPRVTCDVNPFFLFSNTLTQEQRTRHFGASAGTEADIRGIWENLSHVDCFAVGDIRDTGARNSSLDICAFGLQYALPMLLTAVADGRLSIVDLVNKLYTHPVRILNISPSSDTSVSVDLDVEWHVPESAPIFARAPLRGSVQRVTLRGEAVLLDGILISQKASGSIVQAALVPVESDKTAKSVTASAAAGSGADADSSAPAVVAAAAPAPAAPVSRGLEASDAEAVSKALFSSSSVGTIDLRSMIGRKPPTVPSTPAPIQEQPHFEEVEAALSTTHAAAAAAAAVPRAMRHIVSVREFSRQDLHNLFQAAQEMRGLVDRMGSVDILKGKVMTTLFYEPSTRTSCSFQAAMHRLGGSVIDVAVDRSSVQKGETIEDTIRTLESYSDVIVMRHPTAGSVAQAAKVSRIPIVSGGDGVGEHPTQALLDLYTMREELGTVNGLTVTLVGDLKNGRTCHSLVKLLSLYSVRLQYVTHESLRLPAEIRSELDQAGISQVEFSSLEQAIPQTDVLYVTRIQRERFASAEEYDRVKGSFIVSPATLTHAKSRMIVMHPLPRVDEITPEVDYDPRAAYFRQMRYGLFVRMALLARLLAR